jgi:putative flippase GtrA
VADDMRDLIQKYSKYAMVGAAVALIAIGIREFVAALLPSDTPEYYTISIFVAYLCGFVLSYLGHKYISFSHIQQLTFSRGQAMGSFIFIALLGMLVTMLISLTIRYLLPMDKIVGESEASIAFAVGVLVSSVATFWLNRIYTFRGR